MEETSLMSLGPESAPITDPSFWFFNIWNPALSSSGTNSTTPPTTATVTTRAPATTTPNSQVSLSHLFSHLSLFVTNR